MANIFDALDKGIAFGRQQKALDRQEVDRQTLRNLAPQVISGAPGAFAKAAAVNPEQATTLQSAGDSQTRRLKGLVNYVDQARATGDPLAVNAALKQAAPYISELTGSGAPTEWTPDMDAGWEQLKARIAMIDQIPATGLPTGFQEFDLKARAAGLKPGTPEYQQAANIALGREGRAASGGFGFTTITGADGRDRPARNNPRTGVMEVYNEATGNFEPVGGGSSLNVLGGPRPSMEVPFAIDPSLPPEVQAAIRANPQQFASAPEGSNINIPNIMRGAPPVVGRSPEEQTRATEQAKIDAQIANYRQMTGLEAERQAATTAAEAASKAEAERANQAQTRVTNAQRAIPLINEAIRLLPQATGSGVGAARDAAARQLGITTEGAQAAAQLDIVAPQLVGMVPRFEGPQSDADRRLYEAAAGDLNNRQKTVEERVAAAQQMLRLHNKAIQQAPAAPSTPRPQRARNPQTGQVIELRNGQWVPVDG